MASPFFSIVIPTYNRAAKLLLVLDMVSQQQYSDYEVIVVDDGSTDDTAAALANYALPQLHLLQQPNAGVCAARNTGISMALGKFVVMLDSDDSITTTWLHDFHTALAADNFDVAICKRELTKGNQPAAHRFLAGGFAIRRTLLQQIGGYDTQLKFGENTDLRWRLEEEGAKFVYVDGINFLYDNGSAGGGSNVANKIAFFYRVRDKHKQLFSRKPALALQQYQVAGVNCYRLGRFDEAKQLLLQGYKQRPINLKALARYLYYSAKMLLTTKTQVRK